MKKMHWILPVIVLLIGVSLLTLKNYKDVTAAPSESWDREVEIARTTIQSDISATRDSNGNYNISYFTDNGLVQEKYNEALELVDQATYDIPYTKWTEVFLGEKNYIYADYYSMYQVKNNEKISDIQEFIPLENGVIYQFNNNIYYLNGNSLEKSLLTKGLTKETIIDVYQSHANTYIMLSDRKSNVTEYTLLSWDGSNVTEMDEQPLELEPTLTLNELYFTIENNQLSLLVNAVPIDKNSPLPDQNYYFTQQKIGSSITLNPVQFKDPMSQKDLRNLKDIELDVQNGKAELLFRAKGSTKTKFRESFEYNVYEGNFTESGRVTLTRLSNTPWLSKSPAWIDDDIVVWLDVTGDTNKIFVASSTEVANFPEPSLSNDTLLRIAGKTIAMLASGFLTLFATMGWYVFPLGFLGIMMFGSNNALDREKEWVFYAPVLLYLTVALLFNNHLFSERVMSRIPEYLNFQGSPFILISAFGLLTYIIMVTTGLKAKWSIPMRITYFVVIHISFLMIFVGPFLL